MNTCKLDDTIRNLIQSDSIYFIHTIQFTISFIWKRREKYYSNGKTFFNICLHLISLKKFAVNKSILKHSSFSEKFTHKKINESRGSNVFLVCIYYTYMYSCWDIHISLSIRISTNLLEELNSFLQRHFMNSNFSRLLQIIVKNMQKNLA